MNIHDIQKEVIRKFPIGCKFIPVGASSPIKLLEDHNTYKITGNNKSIWAHTGAGNLYKEGKWATLVSLPESLPESIPEYIECTSSKDSEPYFIKGNVYKVVKASPISSAELKCNILKDYKEHNILYTRLVDTDGTKLFKPSTKEAYDAQNTYLKAAEYTPQVGDYVVMEKAGGWGYSPDNNGCVALVSRVVYSEVSSIWGEVINPNDTSRGVKFSAIPQFRHNKEVIFRKALPHEIPSSNVKVEPQQQVEEPKESLTKEKGELERRTQYPITPESAFPVKALRKQLKIVNFQSVHEIKIVEEKLLKKAKSKLFNI